MKICLVNPAQKEERLGVFGRFAPAIPPTGLAYIASTLVKGGFEVVLIDQYARRWDNRRLLKELRIIQPDIVGFSCLTFIMDSVEESCRNIRLLLPHIKIVLGNLHPTVFHRELVQEGIADFVVRGEGEETMHHLCKALRDDEDLRSVNGITFRDNDKVYVNSERSLLSNLDNLPYPNWDFTRGIKYNAFSVKAFECNSFPVPILAARGCAFNCEFCSQNVIYQGLRKRNMQHVVDEIEYHNKTSKYTVFGFVDANFPPDTTYGHRFCDEVIRRNLSKKITWFSETRVDLVDKPLLKKMHDAGLRLIQFGVESGNNNVLTMMNKSFVKERAVDAFKWAKEVGLITVGLFVIGMPQETREQIEDTLRFARYLKPDLVKFSIATPYPGSAIWRRYERYLAEEPVWKYSGWFDMGAKHRGILLEGHRLPSKELLYLQKKGMLLFYAQPRVLKRLILRGIVRPSVFFKGLLTLIQIFFSSTDSFIKKHVKNEKGIPASAN